MKTNRQNFCKYGSLYNFVHRLNLVHRYIMFFYLKPMVLGVLVSALVSVLLHSTQCSFVFRSVGVEEIKKSVN